MNNVQKHKYTYSTYANSVGALVDQPLKAFLSDAPSAALPVTGGLISQTKENIRFNVGSAEIMRVGRASSTVFGELRGEPGNEHFLSMASSTVENLNILDIITADAIVSKVTSVSPPPPGQLEGCGPDSHPAQFYTGGSHFENLKINGTPYNFAANPEFSGGDGFQIKKSGVRRERLFMACPKAIDCPKKDFVSSLLLPASGKPWVTAPDESDGYIHIPQFGAIHLGEVVIYGSKIILTMLRVELGCQTSGSVTAATSSTNGIDA